MKDITETAKRVLALSEQATPGPWTTACHIAPHQALRFHSIYGADHGTIYERDESLREPTVHGHNAKFISATRTDAPELAAYVAAVAPLVERLRVLGDAVCNDHRPTCESASYGSGCHGPADEDVSFWRAAFALLAADAAARGGA